MDVDDGRRRSQFGEIRQSISDATVGHLSHNTVNQPRTAGPFLIPRRPNGKSDGKSACVCFLIVMSDSGHIANHLSAQSICWITTESKRCNPHRGAITSRHLALPAGQSPMCPLGEFQHGLCRAGSQPGQPSAPIPEGAPFRNGCRIHLSSRHDSLTGGQRQLSVIRIEPLSPLVNRHGPRSVLVRSAKGITNRTTDDRANDPLRSCHGTSKPLVANC